MEYKKGFKTKPYQIQVDGSVRFTDGTTNNLFANQITCEAYGYKYDVTSGVCRAYDVQYFNLQEIEKKSNTQLVGNKHKINEGTLDTLVSGIKNETLGNNGNCFISGEENVIDRDINNATVLGKMGKATHEGEVVMSGGGFNSEAGLLQYSILQVSNKTTTATEDGIVLYIDNDSNKGQITLPANSITTYEIWLSGLVTGGDGTAGDYETYEYHGALRTKNDGTITHNAKISRLLGRTGSLGAKTIDTSTAYTLSINVVGLSSTNISWHAVVKLHINKTNLVEIT